MLFLLNNMTYSTSVWIKLLPLPSPHASPPPSSPPPPFSPPPISPPPPPPPSSSPLRSSPPPPSFPPPLPIPVLNSFLFDIPLVTPPNLVSFGTKGFTNVGPQDSVGNDLVLVSQVTWLGCVNSCLDTFNCAGFVYRTTTEPASPLATRNRCYLKFQIKANLVAFPTGVVGYTFQNNAIPQPTLAKGAMVYRSILDAPYNDISQITLLGFHIEDCANRCINGTVPGCVAIVWRHDNTLNNKPTCYYKRAVGNKVPFRSGYSGFLYSILTIAG